jgi:ketopantoate reductase
VIDGSRVEAKVSVVPDASDEAFDLVLVAVRSTQLDAACEDLAGLSGEPAVLFFGSAPPGVPRGQGPSSAG